MQSKVCKIFIVSILTGQFLLLPFFALAQMYVPVSDTANGSGGVSGTVANKIAEEAFSTAERTNGVCDKVEAAYFKTDDNIQMGFGGLELISGGASAKVQLTAKLKALDGFISCRNGVISLVKNIPAPNVFTATKKQNMIADLTSVIASLKAKQEPIKAQLDIATKGFWKSLILQILLKTTKAVATRVVNHLISNYKINDIMQYTDAVASQVYTNQLIRNNAGSGADQLIIRSMLTNPTLRSGISSAVYQSAADALQVNGNVYTTENMDANDPDFYLKLAKYGYGETSPAFLQTVYENRAKEMQNIGLASAQNEVLLGSGLKSPRNCGGNVSEQKAIDQKWNLANDKMQNRYKLYLDLKSAKDTQWNILTAKEKEKLTADLQKAQDDYLAAAKELKGLPETFESPVLKICEKIASPAEAVNKGIDKAFASFTDGMSKYNDNNLPFFMNFISDLGSNISSSLIFGGDPKAVFLSESQRISTAVNMGLNYIDSQTMQKNLENGIEFSAEKDYSSIYDDAYKLTWKVGNVTDAYYVTITGPNLDEFKRDSKGELIVDETSKPIVNRLNLSGQMIVRSSTIGTYTLRVYNSKDVKLTNTATAKPLSAPQVQGAYIESPRGSSLPKASAHNNSLLSTSMEPVR